MLTTTLDGILNDREVKEAMKYLLGSPGDIQWAKREVVQTVLNARARQLERSNRQIEREARRVPRGTKKGKRSRGRST